MFLLWGALAGCQLGDDDVAPTAAVPITSPAPPGATISQAVTAATEELPTASEPQPTLEPTPALVTLVVWGPDTLTTEGEVGVGATLLPLLDAFEQLDPNLQVRYESKARSGPASLLQYLRSASAVAPSVVPDLVILPPSMLPELAQTGLLFPLDLSVAAEIREDLYPFATRDTRLDAAWLALPLAVQVEHGITRAGQREQVPPTLDRLLRDEAPTWLFAGQAREDGELSNALLLQLLTITGAMPRPGVLPEQEDLVALLATLQAAQQVGTIPRQTLLIGDEALLFDRLRSGQVDLIESSSRSYLLEQAEGDDFTWAPLPTMTGEPLPVIDGYLIVMTTGDPRKQAAAARLLAWLFNPTTLENWSRSTGWLPARRTVLRDVVEDEGYANFLDTQLERGWLRPGGTSWSSFAQTLQEQFRAVLTEQVAPPDAADAIIQSYGVEP